MTTADYPFETHFEATSDNATGARKGEFERRDPASWMGTMSTLAPVNAVGASLNLISPPPVSGPRIFSRVHTV